MLLAPMIWVWLTQLRPWLVQAWWKCSCPTTTVLPHTHAHRPPFIDMIQDHQLKEFASKLNEVWKELGREVNQNEHPFSSSVTTSYVVVSMYGR